MVAATDLKLPMAPDPWFVPTPAEWWLLLGLRNTDIRMDDPRHREAARRKFYELVELAMSHEFVISSEELLSWPNLRAQMAQAAPDTIEGWLDVNCPSHARVGLNIGFNDPDELFALKMHWF